MRESCAVFAPGVVSSLHVPAAWRAPVQTMDDARSDEALMVAYAAGDRRAFEVLFARLAPRLHAFFARTLRNPALADELFQLTFLKLHQARASYAPGLPLRPWVFTIAARVRNDEFRRRYRAAEVQDDEALLRADAARAVQASHDAGDAAVRADLAERVRAAVDALPEAQRAVIVLHRFEGLSFGEIAQVLGVREGAVRVRAFRAYESLRRALGGLLQDGDDAAEHPARDGGATA